MEDSAEAPSNRKGINMRWFAVAFSVVLAVVALPVLADDVPPPVRVVANVLSLSDEQVSAWLEILHAREAATRPLQQQLESRHEALNALLGSDSPDPAAVGSLVLAVRAAEKHIAATGMEANARFVELLTPQQRERLQQIREASGVCQIAPALHATGLL